MSDLRTQRFCALPHRGIRSLVGRKDFAHRPGTSSISPDFLAIYIVDLQSEKSQICTISTFGLIFRRNRHRSCPHVDRSTQRSTHTSSLEATDLWGSRCNIRTLPKNVTTKNHPSLPGYPLHDLQSEPEDSLSDLPHHLHGADISTQQSPSQIRSDEGMIGSCKPANSDTWELPERFLRTDLLGSLILSHKGRIHGLLRFWHFVYILTTIAWRSQTSS